MIRTVLRVLIASLAAAAIFVGLVLLGLFAGGADCHQGQCNWFGELIDETAPLYLALAVVVGLAAAWAVLRATRAP